ncbi:MAG: OsmC family protein [Kordiimonadaceae bacterium]|nr:OsmC family protein [Kordiimonadaceae bacterium]
MGQSHTYNCKTIWTGAGDSGTKNYHSYGRDYDVLVDGKATIAGSSDPAFHGDPARHNPEDMLLASVSSCHMLWYLHLCAVNKITVTSYVDAAEGIMSEAEDGSGRFEKITLRPTIIITENSDSEKAMTLHHDANKMCFIANTLNCTVAHEVTITSA